MSVKDAPFQHGREHIDMYVCLHIPSVKIECTALKFKLDNGFPSTQKSASSLFSFLCRSLEVMRALKFHEVGWVQKFLFTFNYGLNRVIVYNDVKRL